MKTKYLNEGYRSKAYVDEKQYICLKGKNFASYESYKKDKKILHFLDKKITSKEIPRNLRLIRKSKKNPYGGVTYPAILGETLKITEKETYDLEIIAKELSGFLKELHSIKVRYKKEDILKKEKEEIEKNVQLLKKYLDEKKIKKLLSWKKRYYQKLEEYENYVLTHGDFWYENYIISTDKKHVNGIIDFEKTTIFMRENDFVPLIYISEKFQNEVINNYSQKLDKELLKLLGVRREVVSFEHTMMYEPNDIEESLNKLQEQMKNN